MSTNKRIQEAEAYSKMGLFSEALALYESILEDSGDILKPDQSTTIQDAVTSLKKDIEAIAKDDAVAAPMDTKNLSILKGDWSDEKASASLSSADAFRELGMYQEAVDEYAKVVGKAELSPILVQGLVNCFCELYSPARVIDQVEKFFESNPLKDKDRVRVNFIVGEEMIVRGHSDLALEFFELVKKEDPDYPDIKKKIDGILANSAFKSRYDYLLRFEIVTAGQLQNALAMSKQSRKSVESVLVDNLRIAKADVGKSLSLYFKCPFKNYDPALPVPYELVRKLKKAFLVKNTWVPLSWDLNRVEIMIDDPSDLTKTDPIPGLINAKKVQYVVGIKEDIEKVIKKFFDEQESNEDVQDGDSSDEFELMPEIDFEEEEEIEDTSYDELTEASGQIVRMVDQILISAYRKSASDIHIEPSGITKKTSIRFRIDGVCQDILQVPNTNARAILSRLKIMSSLDIAERRLPQDGKIKFRRKGIKPFELRMATLPTAGGFEDAVLRILAESGAMKLDSMGFNDRNLTVLRSVVTQPYGLILCVGPTGSGKTTTLHAALGQINKPGIKIWTAEDPVEISQQGLRQVECKPKIGLDFARVMRAFLRADPDIIMIGEMRDHETAAIGIEASLTGHLVLSTLHTNSAPETVTRLLDMGLNPLNFSDAFLAVLAQRLVRRVCGNCGKDYTPSREEYDDIVRDYGEAVFPAEDYPYSDDIKLSHGDGCEECSGTGYRGRLGIHELMEGTKTIKQMIKREAPTDELHNQSVEEGMSTIKQDGTIKALNRQTDMADVRRVCIS